jgi:dolichol-phosphate mannosyltransferase
MRGEGVVVVVPTYDEALTIETVLRGIREALPAACVLVVDDGSPDGTADLAEKLDDELGRISVLRRSEKAGLGAAYRAGFGWALDLGFDVVVEMDADLSHDPAALPRLVGALNSGADLAIGSRYVRGGSTPGWPVRRRLLSRLGGVYASTLLRLGVRDATSGFRAYRASVLERVGVDTLTASGFAFQIETTWRVRACGGVVREVPICFVDRMAGVSKMSGHVVTEALRLVAHWRLAGAPA